MHKNIVVYTCIVGGYDKKLYTPPVQSGQIAFVCFTDDPGIDADGWIVKPLEHDKEKVSRPDLINRYHKFFPHLILQDFDVSIYVDGNIKIIGDLYPLVSKFLESRKIFGCLSHPQRDNIFSEAKACQRLNKFKYGEEKKVEQQLKYYSDKTGQAPLGLFAATILLRKHSEILIHDAMDHWWFQINTYTSRDQLSLPFVLWESKIKAYVLNIDIFENNGFFKRLPHANKYSKISLWRKFFSLKKIKISR